MTIKSSIETLLRPYPPLFRLASTAYHRLRGGMRSLNPDTVDALARAFELAQGEDAAAGTGEPFGDYYEFGLFRGYTLFKAYEIAARRGLDATRFYGFDSFEGLPAATGPDAVDGRFFEGQFACSRAEVEQHLASAGMPMARTRLVEGFFEASLTAELKASLPRRKARIVLVDCDYYTSTRTVLHWLGDLVGFGTVLLFDDWDSYDLEPGRGQPRAFEEFLEAHPSLRAEALGPYPRHGASFVLRGRA
ncbi:MAG: TylF/MycF/NovP-related O-methyltransferase [Vicinamibacterales bacterium]|nr:TylF/MycF/NovP-related O-methyltransferase [Vicinamibacterales bacterium]MDP6609873.1 TylF/MycF/NovP-related O-methyltransferase [Vicinamibacterales bacterium]